MCPLHVVVSSLCGCGEKLTGNIFAVLGWLDPSPIEVRRGQTLEFAVGFHKGEPGTRRRMEVQFNANGKTIHFYKLFSVYCML